MLRLFLALALTSCVALAQVSVKVPGYYERMNNEAIVLKAQADLISLQQRMIENPSQPAQPAQPAEPAKPAAPAQAKEAAAKRPLSRALTNRGRFDDADFVRDLKNSPVRSTGKGGTMQPLSLLEFPALEGEGLAFTLFNLEPCGINLPHVHPRATEMIYVLRGHDLKSAFVEENDGRTVVNTVKAGEVTFFPQGLIHYQQNLGCDPVEFLSALNSEDPGVVTISSRTFTLPSEALEATFALTAEQVKIIKDGIPAGPAKGRIECLKRCGLDTETKV